MFPQLPVLIYLGYLQEVIFPADSICATLLIILLIFELIVSFVTLKLFIRDKTKRFRRYCKLEAETKKKMQQLQEAEVAYWSKYTSENQIENDC